MSVFTTREYASAIWSVAFVAYALMMASRDKRASLWQSLVRLVKSFVDPYILVPTIVMAVYVALVVWLLDVAGVWRVAVLKETVVWFLATVGIAFHLSAAARDKNIWKAYVADSVKLLVVIQFVLEKYTFAFWEEMFIVPLVAFPLLLDVVPTKPEHVYSMRLLKNIQTIVIGVILVLAVGSAIADYRNLGSLDTARSLLIAPLLSVAFVPFIYALRLYANYELLFVNLKIGPAKSRALKRYARRRLIFHFGLNSAAVLGFIRNAKRKGLHRVQTKADVDELLRSD